MSRLTKKEKRVDYFLGLEFEYDTDCLNAIDKLGKIEDILEEYGIEDLTELKIALDYFGHRYDGVSTKRVDKKETPMKVGKIQPVVLEEDIKNYGNARFNLCPKCQRIVYPFHISDYSKIKYCENCGQKLDWSDTNE